MLQQKKERNYHYDQSISLQNDYLRMLLKSRIKGDVFFLLFLALDSLFMDI